MQQLNQPTNLYHSELQFHDHGKLFQVEVTWATTNVKEKLKDVLSTLIPKRSSLQKMVFCMSNYQEMVTEEQNIVGG